MATAEENITALEEALASGALEVDMPDGRRVKYRNTSDLRDAIAYFKAQINQAGNGTPVQVTVGGYFRS